MGNLHDHAEAELKGAGLLDQDGPIYGNILGTAILQLIDLFEQQGHTGMSAKLASGLFDKLSRFQPLYPLTGEDDEWEQVADGVWQNKRCHHVFKQTDRFDGQAYDIDGRVFVDANGAHSTRPMESFVPITFPYMPTVEYVYESTPGDETS